MNTDETPFNQLALPPYLILTPLISLAMAILWHFTVDYAPQFVLSEMNIGLAVWAQVIVTLVVALVLILLFGVNPQSSSLRRPSIISASPAKVE